MSSENRRGSPEPGGRWIVLLRASETTAQHRGAGCVKQEKKSAGLWVVPRCSAFRLGLVVRSAIKRHKVAVRLLSRIRLTRRQPCGFCAPCSCAAEEEGGSSALVGRGRCRRSLTLLTVPEHPLVLRPSHVLLWTLRLPRIAYITWRRCALRPCPVQSLH